MLVTLLSYLAVFFLGFVACCAVIAWYLHTEAKRDAAAAARTKEWLDAEHEKPKSEPILID